MKSHLRKPGPGSLAVVLMASAPAGAQFLCQIAKLVPSNPANNQAFGISIAIHGDACAIGAPWIAQTTLPAGRVYVFDRTNGT